mmetsp:Transcript_24431/g.36591  ORF Transcript_24431/g.36591 Transcript_24431/m.36591 type:complete len:107 (+) Transcript_24431:1929-2249(+)
MMKRHRYQEVPSLLHRLLGDKTTKHLLLLQMKYMALTEQNFQWSILVVGLLFCSPSCKRWSRQAELAGGGGCVVLCVVCCVFLFVVLSRMSGDGKRQTVIFTRRLG